MTDIKGTTLTVISPPDILKLKLDSPLAGFKAWPMRSS